MKANIHPTWYPEAKVSCACGNIFVLGLSVPQLQVDVCYNCHPFYTGQMKFIDRAGRVESFRAKIKNAKAKVVSKSQKRELKRAKKISEELERPTSLEELRTSKKRKN